MYAVIYSRRRHAGKKISPEILFRPIALLAPTLMHIPPFTVISARRWSSHSLRSNSVIWYLMLTAKARSQSRSVVLQHFSLYALCIFSHEVLGIVSASVRKRMITCRTPREARHRNCHLNRGYSGMCLLTVWGVWRYPLSHISIWCGTCGTRASYQPLLVCLMARCYSLKYVNFGFTFPFVF